MLFASSVSLRPYMEAGVHLDPKLQEEIKRRLERETELPVNRADFFYTTSMARLNEVRNGSRPKYFHLLMHFK